MMHRGSRLSVWAVMGRVLLVSRFVRFVLQLIGVRR